MNDLFFRLIVFMVFTILSIFWFAEVERTAVENGSEAL